MLAVLVPWNLPQLAIDELLDYVGRMRAIGIQSRKAGDRKGWRLKQGGCAAQKVCSVVIISHENPMKPQFLILILDFDPKKIGHMLHGAGIFTIICPNKITQFCR